MNNEDITNLILRCRDSDGRVHELLHDCIAALTWQQQQIQILARQVLKDQQAA